MIFRCNICHVLFELPCSSYINMPFNFPPCRTCMTSLRLSSSPSKLNTPLDTVPDTRPKNAQELFSLWWFSLSLVRNLSLKWFLPFERACRVNYRFDELNEWIDIYCTSENTSTKGRYGLNTKLNPVPLNDIESFSPPACRHFWSSLHRRPRLHETGQTEEASWNVASLQTRRHLLTRPEVSTPFPRRRRQAWLHDRLQSPGRIVEKQEVEYWVSVIRMPV